MTRPRKPQPALFDAEPRVLTCGRHVHLWLGGALLCQCRTMLAMDDDFPMDRLWCEAQQDTAA